MLHLTQSVTNVCSGRLQTMGFQTALTSAAWMTRAARYGVSSNETYFPNDPSIHYIHYVSTNGREFINHISLVSFRWWYWQGQKSLLGSGSVPGRCVPLTSALFWNHCHDSISNNGPDSHFRRIFLNDDIQLRFMSLSTGSEIKINFLEKILLL